MSDEPTTTAKRYRVSAVVFDLDGVIVDSESVNVRSASLAFLAIGCPLRPEHAAEIVGRHPVDYVPDLAARAGLPPEEAPRLLELQSANYGRLWREEARLEDGAAETLRALRARGFPLALATSAGRRHANDCLGRFGLEKFFEVILTKDDVAQRKPSPEIYLLCAGRLGIEPPAMLVIEDSGPGVRAARAAGARCVAVRTEHTPEDRLAGADTVIDSLRELPDLLEREPFVR